MRKISLIATSLVLGTVLFSGCAVKSGNDKLQDVTKESVTDMIKNGTSTKSEVRSKLGEPTNIDFMENGLEKWEYNHTRKVDKGINYVPVVNWFVKGTNDTKKILVVLFDGEVVKNHSFSSSEGETMGGLVR
ncbi:outer membrane protein assembly factor BamE [Aliarcobacter butzleri]|jgi:outer membrane protein assembly factor BamE (lipoprotein component of BamABCDE complex)|uniref:outer membrane protein assembly factor BamE n=1 Tax=Aliarcobacter TaxID=2321111 RepID=UPI0010FD8F59|nr:MULTISPECIES: outer membrane protein assembly factor BamE [Aliarcobacter]MCT7482464.1 outer membrane protein assembly factor BamE [Aliarcobacter cryaerophilus]MCT7566564.1 outer membrane protein assembly factor BamE [Aliarcobacter butzleri]TLT02793.1 outer membrane protein assembly factor BamE [Aliarcobacter cibarius]